MRDFKDLTVPPDATIREAMGVIDEGAAEIVLVSNAADELLGTVTDGDVRRAILRGDSLEEPISSVMTRDFTSVGPETSDDEVLGLMRSRDLKQIPVLTAEGELLGVHLLHDLLEHPVRPNWTVIMAGGKGTRLRPLTESVPKPMLEVGGRPLLERTVSQLAGYGLKRIFLSVGYLGERIVEHFGDGGRFGCDISYLREEEPLGTGGPLGLLGQTPSHPLLVLNGDLITEVNFSALLDFHGQHGFPATLCVKEFSQQIPYGVCRTAGRELVEIEEKPTTRFFINAGIYVLNPAALELIPEGRFDLPELLRKLRERGDSVGAFPIMESWTDVGRREDFERARAELGEEMGE